MQINCVRVCECVILLYIISNVYVSFEILSMMIAWILRFYTVI